MYHGRMVCWSRRARTLFQRSTIRTDGTALRSECCRQGFVQSGNQISQDEHRMTPIYLAIQTPRPRETAILGPSQRGGTIRTATTFRCATATGSR